MAQAYELLRISDMSWQDGRFQFDWPLDSATDLNRVRLHLPGLRSLVVNLDFSLAPSPVDEGDTEEQGRLGTQPDFLPSAPRHLPWSRRSSRPDKTSYRFSSLRPLSAVEQQATQNADRWCVLEARVRESSPRLEAEAEAEAYEDLRQWALDWLESSDLEPERLWDVAHRAASVLLGAECWWAVQVGFATTSRASRRKLARISPYLESQLNPYLDWRADKLNSEQRKRSSIGNVLVDIDSFSEVSKWIARYELFLEDAEYLEDLKPESGVEAGLQNSSTGNPLLDNKLRFECFVVGASPRPSSKAHINFVRLMADAATHLRGVKKAKLISTPSAVENASEKEERQDSAESLLGKEFEAIASEIFTLCDTEPALSGSPLTGELYEQYINYPMVMMFLIKNSEGQYQYIFSPAQQQSIRESGGIRKVRAAWTPNEIIEHVCKHKSIMCLPTLEAFLGTMEAQGAAKRAEAAPPATLMQALVRYLGGAPQAMMWIPISGAVLGGEAHDVPVVVQLNWPVFAPPLVPALCDLLQKSVLDLRDKFNTAYRAYEFAQTFGRYEFVRQLAYFLAHNLGKATVTPLMSLTHKIRELPGGPPLAARVQGVASLLDVQLKTLDVFRLPGSRELETELVDLREVLEDLSSLFEELKNSRCDILPSFAKVADSVNLETDFDQSLPLVVRGHRPALFHCLMVPIENAFKAISPAEVSKDPNCGRISAVLRAIDGNSGNASGEPAWLAELVISDRAGGMAKEVLDKLRARVAKARDEILSGHALSFEWKKEEVRGANLGMGLILCAASLAQLRNSQNEAGQIEINSVEGQGTEVRVRFPNNLSQKVIQYS